MQPMPRWQRRPSVSWKAWERITLGIGWGHIIGDVVKCMEQKNRLVPLCTSVCPLIGNGGVGLKNYHSNELVRAIAEHSGAQA